jgi:hypothetical protein
MCGRFNWNTHPVAVLSKLIPNCRIPDAKRYSHAARRFGNLKVSGDYVANQTVPIVLQLLLIKTTFH